MKNRGFTFIEMLVVVGIIGLLIPVVFSIIVVILRQQLKVVRLSQIKRDGDYALNVLENTVRNHATKIFPDYGSLLTDELCNDAGETYPLTPPNSQLYFDDSLNQRFGFYLTAGNQIASDSAILNGVARGSVELVSNKVEITSFNISCQKGGTYSPPIITVSFDIRYKTTSTRPEETASLRYQTKIKLRSY